MNVKNIYFDNSLKIFYYNIIRGTLKTNRIVHHFVEGLTPACTFCATEVETIMHLFWECRLVETFIEVTIDNIGNDYPVFAGNYSMKSFIFGIRSEPIYSAHNLSALLLKRYIWIARRRRVLPEYIAFQRWFKKELRLNKACYEDDINLSYLTVIFL